MAGFRFLVLILALMPHVRAWAEGQLTLVNVGRGVDFGAYSLKANDFRYAPGTAHDDLDTLRLCESIDNSRLIVFGLGKEKVFAETSAFVFGTPAVARSLDAFFARGGLLYFEPSSWSVYNSWSKKARDFFAARGVPVPDGANYKDVDSEKPERTTTGTATADAWGRLFAQPRVPEPLHAIRHFAGKVADAYVPCVVDAAGRKLLMGHALGAGRIVFSLVFSVHRSATSAFWDNVVEAQYGKTAVQKQASRTRYLETARQMGRTGLHIREIPLGAPCFTDMPPPVGGEELAHIDLLLARGERELAEIVFFNCTEENYLFRLEGDRQNPVHTAFRFLDVKPRRTEFGRVQNEIATPPDASGTICAPSGETKALLLAAEARDLAPGRHTWGFTLVPVNFEAPPRTITVTAEVLDLEMTGDWPAIYLFGPYEMSWSLGQVAAYQDFLADAYHVNYISTAGDIWKKVIVKDAAGNLTLSARDEDYLLDEARLQRLGRRWIYGYGLMAAVEARFRALGETMDWQDADKVALVDRALARRAAVLRARGIDFSQAYEPVRDEPHTGDIANFIRAAELVRRHGMKVAVDIATWCTLEDIRRLAPHVDMWEPWEHRLTQRDTAAEELAIYRSTGKPIRPYLCSMSGNTDPYLDYHRFRGIKAFLLGGDGFCTWAANSWRGNDYRAKDNQLAGVKGQFPGAFYVHHGDAGPVATLRLEMLREGVEDLYWLRRAVREGKAAELRSTAALKALVEAQDPARTKAWRNALLRALATEKVQSKQRK